MSGNAENRQGSGRKRVAVIMTEYRFNSHADVIVTRLLGEMDFSPRIDVASFYTDQVPHNDMSREMAEKYSIPIYPTIGEAVKAPYRSGGLDGVVIIGEHGDYPVNEKRQKEYPRCRLLRETLEALDELGIVVPIFSDKHLSYDMDESVWMFEQLNRRGIPFLGGSSIPHSPAMPSYDPALLKTANEWLAISYSASIEAYGFHGFEVLQSIAERRSGGESGVRSVWAVEGDDVWKAMDEGKWPEELMLRALEAFPDRKPGHPRELQQQPVLFAAEYADGSKGYVLQLLNLVNRWGYAFRSGDRIVSARIESGLVRPFVHFAILTEMIEDLILMGEPPFPPERTLMTTGQIHYGMESLYRKAPVETPRLLFSYGSE